MQSNGRYSQMQGKWNYPSQNKSTTKSNNVGARPRISEREASTYYSNKKKNYDHVSVDGRKNGTNGVTTLRRTDGVTSLMDSSVSPQKDSIISSQL